MADSKANPNNDVMMRRADLSTILSWFGHCKKFSNQIFTELLNSIFPFGFIFQQECHRGVSRHFCQKTKDQIFLMW